MGSEMCIRDRILGDLSRIHLHRQFDAIVMAGNVMIFLTPGTESEVLAYLSVHLKPNGLLLSAFELTPHPWTDLTIDVYDVLLEVFGFTKISRWSTWDQDPWQDSDTYAVTLHQKPTDFA